LLSTPLGQIGLILVFEFIASCELGNSVEKTDGKILKSRLMLLIDLINLYGMQCIDWFPCLHDLCEPALFHKSEEARLASYQLITAIYG
jgi:hypothetical protein